MTQITLPNKTKTKANPVLSSDWYDNDNAIKTVVNGELDNENIKANAGITRSKLAADAKGIVGTWYTPKVIATEESRTNTAFGTLTTADEITGVVVPENGLLVVDYQALWKSSVAQAGEAAIFIGSNQYKVRVQGSDAPQTIAAITRNTTAFHPLVSQGAAGLLAPTASSASSADVTTGQGIGFVGETAITNVRIGGSGAIGFPLIGGAGSCEMFLAAGTYAISIQFKASSGTVTAKERKLWVRVYGG